MIKIEKKMAAYFEELNNNKKAEEVKEEPEKNIVNNKEEKPADAVDEDNNKRIEMEQDMNEAFAKIVSVENGSPAEEAGLKPEDHIINFNGILYKGVSHNPLITLSEIVKSKIGEEIPISIVRKNKDNILQMEKLNINQNTRNRRRVLGCKFKII